MVIGNAPEYLDFVDVTLIWMKRTRLYQSIERAKMKRIRYALVILIEQATWVTVCFVNQVGRS